MATTAVPGGKGWLREADALELVEPLLRGNARRIFRLEEKLERLARAPWLQARGVYLTGTRGSRAPAGLPPPS